VTGAVDSAEGQAVVLSDVAAHDLAHATVGINEVWTPVFHNFKVHGVDPHSSTGGRHGSIGIS